ncbi:MAG: PAS domain S-box protein, partial [Candidatus Thorarchaeota archaeon]
KWVNTAKTACLTVAPGRMDMDRVLFQAMVDGSDEGMAVVNEDLKVVYINAALCSTLGLKTADILDHHLNEISPLEFLADRVAEKVAAKTSIPSRSALRVPGDALGKEADCRVVLDSVRTPGGIFVILRFDEEHATVFSRREADLPYDVILDTAIDGVAVDDVKGRFTYVNRALAKMIGRTREELLGRRWVEFTKVPDDDFLFEKMALRRVGETERYELEWVRPDGSIVPTLVSASPYYDEHGNFVGSVAVITDISELKEAEETVKFYLSLLTHDISNQLQVILTSTGLLDSELPASYVDEARRDITEALERCNRLITKIKRAAKMRDLPIGNIDLTSVLKEKIKVVERVYEAKVHVENFERPIMVRANALLGELLWNLLENAARHNPREDKHIWVKGFRKDEYFGISIEDNGPGIGDAKKAILFDKSRRSGGVGLTLVAHMARECGGWVEVHDRVEGNPSQGAKFVLYLPLAE